MTPLIFLQWVLALGVAGLVAGLWVCVWVIYSLAKEDLLKDGRNADH